MSEASSLSNALRAVAERVEQGETLATALRHVASELEAAAARVPSWQLAIVDESLADGDEGSEPWEDAIATVRGEISRT